MEYYGGKGTDEVINGMMITPLENELLITILQKGVKYPQLYKLFHELQENSLAPKEWYAELKEKIAEMQWEKGNKFMDENSIITQDINKMDISKFILWGHSHPDTQTT